MCSDVDVTQLMMAFWKVPINSGSPHDGICSVHKNQTVGARREGWIGVALCSLWHREWLSNLVVVTHPGVVAGSVPMWVGFFFFSGSMISMAT